ncbi:heme exporter protein CcmD [Deefgea piscis]|uniref:Heme exporter protein D n=1 Tax=Deefgea piscis TaxID=2739061 RepID=A0A6M8SLU7_9NEIS|nr:heme exporter protein CcmD [Deefgea piscis]QKJ66063.1 heme exporter protein CcmD [Deefgea piscis]
MYWNNLSDFIAMGNHGVYVWGSFFACAAALCLEWVLIKSQRRSIVRQIRRAATIQHINQKPPAVSKDAS